MIKPRYRVPARRPASLTLIQPAFVDGSAAARICREMAERCDRGEVVSVGIVGQMPNGGITTQVETGHPGNIHCLVSGCMTLLRRIQDDMEW
jgi:hypothetical protein